MDSKPEPLDVTKPKVGSLRGELADALPEGFQSNIRYVRSISRPCEPLFSPPPEAEPEKTRLASHFLTVSWKAESKDGSKSNIGTLVYGIEVLVYTTKHFTTLFVSKADSTGFLPQQRPSAVRTITTTFLQWLSANERHKRPNRKLVISLFARSQSQYLFPGSAENAKKHVLDDRQLIKWWARVLDPIIQKRDGLEMSNGVSAAEYQGYVTVPGYQGTEIRPFLPSQSLSMGSSRSWRSGDPLMELAETRGLKPDAPPRCLLPRFPDDPKARFIRDLDDEVGISDDPSSMLSPSKRKSGKWNSIRNLDRFWESMEFRQECSSGRVVGFIWLVIRPPRPAHSQPELAEKQEVIEASQDSSLGALSSDPVSQPDNVSVASQSPSKRKSKPLSGPIIPRKPRLKGGSSSLTASSDLAGMLDTSLDDGLVLSREGYDKAMATLMHLDFANLDIAIQSTRKWVSEVSGIGGIQSDWSLDIVGSAKSHLLREHASVNGKPQVIDLGDIARKKRKAVDQAIAEGHEVAETRVNTAGEEKPVVNILGGGIIRKKPKPATS